MQLTGTVPLPHTTSVDYVACIDTIEAIYLQQM